ncbi:uncharacterized protein LOC129406846 [Sorex araneus]|uniref:uncharacterized protein LOC129406846 n=1 Tax=Sorex araneus TaxID=42254 RepID=UPI002433B4E6|nr:uncharacterized protein LOC129406846 [Sorex araneus]
MRLVVRCRPCGFAMMILLLTVQPTEAGLGRPADPTRLLQQLYGTPCNCQGGQSSVTPTSYTKTVDCGTLTIYLVTRSSARGGLTQFWQCVPKPTFINKGDPCPQNCQVVDQMNAMCYTSYSECTLGGKRYFTAKPHMSYEGTFGGDWSVVPSSRGNPKYAAASCTAPVGKDACWPTRAPLHVTDGGPSDVVREREVGQQI